MPGLAVGGIREGGAMQAMATRTLTVLALLAIVLLGHRPVALASGARPARAVAEAATVPPAAVDPETPARLAAVASADLPLVPCSLAAHRHACDGYASELAAYGLDIQDPVQWTAFGLWRFVEAVERLADAFGGGGVRARRIARLSLALGTDTGSGRIAVVWQAVPQAREGNPVRGGYAADRLYFNPNTLFLDTDTPEEARERSPEGTWWLYIHELAHLWDERSALAAEARLSAAMRRWVGAQDAAGVTGAYPSSYAVIGGPAEAFAESVAATVTGDAAARDYYGSPRDHFVRSALCEATDSRP